MLRILLATTLLAPAAALNVAVAGATGRVGRLVVQTLLDEGNSVVALARSAEKASEVLPKAVDCRCVDFGTAGAADVQTALASADHLIWCASGFTESGESIDALGLKAVTESSFKGTVVMCSSAGVTRPEWSESKSARLVGAADIPIIRLNPGGILQQKAKAEQMLRDSGLAYSIVRPTGLKFDGWPRGRPILSQGDVAVGRTNPDGLAAVLVGALLGFQCSLVARGLTHYELRHPEHAAHSAEQLDARAAAAAAPPPPPRGAFDRRHLGDFLRETAPICCGAPMANLRRRWLPPELQPLVYEPSPRRVRDPGWWPPSPRDSVEVSYRAG